MKDDTALEEAGIAHAQAILICTNDDLANLEVAVDARRMRPEIRIVVRQFDQQLASKLRAAFNIDYAFSSSALSAATVASMSLPCKVVSAFELGGIPYVTVRVEVGTGSAFATRTVAQIEGAHGAQVLFRAPSGGGRDETPPASNAVVRAGTSSCYSASERIAGIAQAEARSGARSRRSHGSGRRASARDRGARHRARGGWPRCAVRPPATSFPQSARTSSHVASHASVTTSAPTVPERTQRGPLDQRRLTGHR